MNDSPPSDTSSDVERLANYLRGTARDSGGELYVKCKFISDELGYSTKQLGALMHQLQRTDSDLVVEQWSNARATTWYVSLDAR